MFIIHKYYVNVGIYEHIFSHIDSTCFHPVGGFSKDFYPSLSSREWSFLTRQKSWDPYLDVSKNRGKPPQNGW